MMNIEGQPMEREDITRLESQLALAPEIYPPQAFTLHNDGSVTVKFSPQFLHMLYDMVLVSWDEERRHLENPTEEERRFREEIAQSEGGLEKIEAGRQYFDAVCAVVANVQLLAYSSEERVLSPGTIKAGRHMIDRLGIMFKRLGITRRSCS